MTADFTTASIRSILLDIEGTTTPISFVHQTLFSYARERLQDYLVARWESAELVADIGKLREGHATDLEQGLSPPPMLRGAEEDEIVSVVAYVNWLIDRDRKSTALKILQGKIWKQGYLEGTLQAELFEDVAPALKEWSKAGLSINIFSSGSSLAQQLLFAHTQAGDFTDLIHAYFDTTNGPKTAVASYRRIALTLGLPAQNVLFISDVAAELDAAEQAGMQTALCMRPGNASQPDGQRHRIVHTFRDVLI